ncbi:DUF6090 family protein [Algoriphagus litoralis]|uniref:DUF6090 family protein n=1 Tax=Algoriphagus litoralis TaxID=2202829 RepID=UPI000DBA9ABC|nr:DUF6090 family protein [Algoriphagus litoralis]
MISLFRKIRHSFLKEQKITQYLAYAIGEIFLVVIGILIALQINTWNEERKNRAYEIKMLRELKSTLDKDIRYFSSQIRMLHDRERSANKLLEYYQTQEGDLDSLNFHMENLETGALFQYNAGTYGSIKSGGIDKITNDSLRSKMADLYEFLIPRTEKLLENIKENEKKEAELMEGFTLRMITEAKDGDQIISQKITDKASIKKEEFLEFVQINKSTTHYSLVFLDRLLPRLNELATIVALELDKN